MTRRLLRRTLRLMITWPVVLLAFVVGAAIWIVLPDTWPGWLPIAIGLFVSFLFCFEGVRWRGCRIILIALLGLNASGEMATGSVSEFFGLLERRPGAGRTPHLIRPVVMGVFSLLLVYAVARFPFFANHLNEVERLELAALIGTFLTVYTQHPRLVRHLSAKNSGKLTFLWSINCGALFLAGGLLFKVEKVFNEFANLDRELWHVVMIVVANVMMCLYDREAVKAIADPEERQIGLERYLLLEFPTAIGVIVFVAGVWYLSRPELGKISEGLLAGALVQQFFLSASLCNVVEERIVQRAGHGQTQ